MSICTLVADSELKPSPRWPADLRHGQSSRWTLCVSGPEGGSPTENTAQELSWLLSLLGPQCLPVNLGDLPA